MSKSIYENEVHFSLHSEALCVEDASRISNSALRSTEFVTLRHKFLVE
jgi:hypothetical protein